MCTALLAHLSALQEAHREALAEMRREHGSEREWSGLVGYLSVAAVVTVMLSSNVCSG